MGWIRKVILARMSGWDMAAKENDALQARIWGYQSEDIRRFTAKATRQTGRWPAGHAGKQEMEKQ